MITLIPIRELNTATPNKRYLNIGKIIALVLFFITNTRIVKSKSELHTTSVAAKARSSSRSSLPSICDALGKLIRSVFQRMIIIPSAAIAGSSVRTPAQSGTIGIPFDAVLAENNNAAATRELGGLDMEMKM